MQTTLLLTIVSALVIGAAVYNMQPKQQLAEYPDHILDSWKQWKSTYRSGNLYVSMAEENYRLSVFSSNYATVHTSNSNPKHTFKLALNKFADLTTKEFATTYLKATIDTKFSEEEQNQEVVDERNGNLTEVDVDWVTAGRVTRIKDQGQCGSCWAFGATGALEGLYAKTNGKQQEFAEQQLVDCWHGSIFPPRMPCLGCKGGQSGSAMGYVSSYGIMAESDYLYTAKDGKCAYDKNRTVFKNKSYTNVKAKCNTCLKSAVHDQPVTVAIYAIPIQHYTSGVYNGPCNDRPDHAVLVVGYGTDNGQKYWKIKNSWGTGFGEKGYFRILRQDATGLGQCQIASQPAFPY